MLRLIAGGIQEQATSLVVGQGLSLAQDDTGLPVLQAGGLVVTRTLPTTANAYVEVGRWQVASGAHNLDVSVTVGDAGFSVAKRYLLVGRLPAVGGTYDLTPATDTGASGGNDVALEAVVASTDLTLRLRRTGTASLAGTAVVTIRNYGKTDAAFAERTGTGTSATNPPYPYGPAGGGTLALEPPADDTGSIGAPTRRWQAGYFSDVLSVGEPTTDTPLNVSVPTAQPTGTLARIGVFGRTEGFSVGWDAATQALAYYFRRGPLVGANAGEADTLLASYKMGLTGGGLDGATEPFPRYLLLASGGQYWGAGDASVDTVVYRQAPGQLSVGSARGAADAASNSASRVRAVKDQGAVTADAFTRSHFEAYSGDGSPVGYGFHRAGLTGVALYHDGAGTDRFATGEAPLKTVDGSGLQSVVLTDRNVYRAAVSLTEPSYGATTYGAAALTPSVYGTPGMQAQGQDSAVPFTGSTAHYYWGYQRQGAWVAPYPDLVLGYHTGVVLGGHWSYGGTRIYNGHPDVAGAAVAASVAEGDQNTRVYGGLVVQADLLPGGAVNEYLRAGKAGVASTLTYAVNEADPNSHGVLALQNAGTVRVYTPSGYNGYDQYRPGASAPDFAVGYDGALTWLNQADGVADAQITRPGRDTLALAGRGAVVVRSWDATKAVQFTFAADGAFVGTQQAVALQLGAGAAAAVEIPAGNAALLPVGTRELGGPTRRWEVLYANALSVTGVSNFGNLTATLLHSTSTLSSAGSATIGGGLTVSAFAALNGGASMPTLSVATSASLAAASATSLTVTNSASAATLIGTTVQASSKLRVGIASAQAEACYVNGPSRFVGTVTVADTLTASGSAVFQGAATFQAGASVTGTLSVGAALVAGSLAQAATITKYQYVNGTLTGLTVPGVVFSQNPPNGATADVGTLWVVYT